KGLDASRLLAANPKKVPPGVWGGNVPTWWHDLGREGGKIPQGSPSRRVDVCVIGGGLAGLAAAYKLRDTNVLVLEHLDRLGGPPVGRLLQDILFFGGSAYLLA